MSGGIFDKLASALFGAGAQPADTQAEQQLVADTIDAVVDAIEPRVRKYERYREKLDGCVRHTIAHLRSIGRDRLEPVLLSRAAWAGDPRVKAFFAKADGVEACLAGNAELRAFFEDRANAGVAEAYALLGMKKEGAKFSGHRLVAPAATLAATRLETGRRIVLRIAQVAASNIDAAEARAAKLERRKENLGARLRALRLGRDGMQGVVQDPANIAREITTVERELARTVTDYIDTAGGVATIEGYIGHINEVFWHPERHVALSHGEKELDLAELSIGADFHAAVAIVRCPRSELPMR